MTAATFFPAWASRSVVQREYWPDGFFFPPFGPSGPALEGWTAVKYARGRPFSPEWPATGGVRPALLGGPQPPFGRPVPRGVGRSDFIPQTPAPHPRLNLRSFCSGDVPKSGASTSQTPFSLLRTANGEHAAADAERAAAGSKTGFTYLPPPPSFCIFVSADGSLVSRIARPRISVAV